MSWYTSIKKKFFTPKEALHHHNGTSQQKWQWVDKTSHKKPYLISQQCEILLWEVFRIKSIHTSCLFHFSFRLRQQMVIIKKWQRASSTVEIALTKSKKAFLLFRLESNINRGNNRALKTIKHPHSYTSNLLLLPALTCNNCGLNVRLYFFRSVIEFMT